MTKPGSSLLQRFLPFVVLVVSCCFLAYLLSAVKPGVYFSGDAGLKTAQVRQMAVTGKYKTLNASQPQWVNDIWAHGYYPFKPPFVYNLPEGKVIAFPPLFQWMSVPFYTLFGDPGLYFIPCASLVLLWIWMISLLYKADLAPSGITSAIFLLALGSPLTIYGAMYWEHCTACLFLFANVDFMVRKPRSMATALALGTLSGVAAWLRPEAIVIGGLFIMLALYDYLRQKQPAYLAFAFASLLITSGFFIFNHSIYGNFLGAHGLQVLNETNSPGKLTLLTHINAKLAMYFPAALLFFTLIVYLFIKRPQWPPEIYRLAFVTVIFSLFTPLILPNAGGKQWGPRYFLPLIPIMTVALCLAMKQLPGSGRPWRGLAIVVLIIMVYSAYLNIYQAAVTLRSDYSSRVFPALQHVDKDTCDVIIVQNQFISQEFAKFFTVKKIFLAENSEAFTAIIPKLHAAGVRRVLYVNITNDRQFLPERLQEKSYIMRKIGAYYVGSFALF